MECITLLTATDNYWWEERRQKIKKNWFRGNANFGNVSVGGMWALVFVDCGFMWWSSRFHALWWGFP
jgi:hypothetical protein